MGSRRTVILIAAVLIGAVAGYALYNYVNGVEDRAYDNAKRVQVFVVKQPIAKGTPGDQAVGDKLVQAGQIPQEFRPATAITDTAVLDGKVALTNLVPGQVVVDGMRTALSLLDDTSLQGNIIVFQAGGDDVSVSTQGEVEGDLLDSNVMVFGVGLDTGELSSGDLQSQVSATHGTYNQLDDMSRAGDTVALVDGTINAQVLL